MSEPENQTLRVLIEFRNEFRQFKSDSEQKFARFEERLEILTQSLAGIVGGNQYIIGGIQGRFEGVERRLTTLEQSR